MTWISTVARWSALVLGAASPFSAQAQVAGSVGAVNSDATGAPPGSSPKPLSVGRSIVQNERIQTNASGTAHLMFNDKSALNVGRNSTVVIDRFVYNPGGGGNQAMTLSRGAARFVGGQISHSSEATVKTPVATIGIRGGNATMLIDGPGQLTVMTHNGVAVVANEMGSRVVPTGYQLIVQAGAPLGEPTRIQMDVLRQATRRLASVGAQTGGAQRLPTDSDAARNAIGLPRAPAVSPNFDLPAAADEVIRGGAATKNQRGVIAPSASDLTIIGPPIEPPPYGP